MQAVVPSAGEGTRLRPLTENGNGRSRRQIGSHGLLRAVRQDRCRQIRGDGGVHEVGHHQLRRRRFRDRHFPYFGDRILGPDVSVSAGTKVATLPQDDVNVRMRNKGMSVDSDRLKFGVVRCDDVKTCINTRLNADVKIASSTPAQGETDVEGNNE